MDRAQNSCQTIVIMAGSQTSRRAGDSHPMLRHLHIMQRCPIAQNSTILQVSADSSFGEAVFGPAKPEAGRSFRRAGPSSRDRTRTAKNGIMPTSGMATTTKHTERTKTALRGMVSTSSIALISRARVVLKVSPRRRRAAVRSFGAEMQLRSRCGRKAGVAAPWARVETGGGRWGKRIAPQQEQTP